MRAYVFCSSRTGNTQLLADLIEETCHDRLVPSADEAEVVFLGSWTNRGQMDEKAQEMAKSLRGKKVFLFGTCGFGSDDYYDKLYQRAAELLDDSNEIIGHFYCQGKMPLEVRARYVEMLRMHPEDQMLQVSVRNYDAAANHPNREDGEALKAALAALSL